MTLIPPPPLLLGAGIELKSGAHAGRLVHVLILTAGNVLDVAIYSDDGGKTWLMSATPLPQNGEAQVAEVVRQHQTTPTIVFNGRSHQSRNNHPYLRGIAYSRDDAASFEGVGFASDLSSGISCLASMITNPSDPTALLFSHPSGSNAGSRSRGVRDILLTRVH